MVYISLTATSNKFKFLNYRYIPSGLWQGSIKDNLVDTIIAQGKYYTLFTYKLTRICTDPMTQAHTRLPGGQWRARVHVPLGLWGASLVRCFLTGTVASR